MRLGAVVDHQPEHVGAVVVAHRVEQAPAGPGGIQVELGGAEVFSISFGTPSEIEQSFRIPAHALKPGRNVLSLRLLASSTTPLRVHWIAVSSLR